MRRSYSESGVTNVNVLRGDGPWRGKETAFSLRCPKTAINTLLLLSAKRDSVKLSGYIGAFFQSRLRLPCLFGCCECVSSVADNRACRARDARVSPVSPSTASTAATLTKPQRRTTARRRRRRRRRPRWGGAAARATRTPCRARGGSCCRPWWCGACSACPATSSPSCSS